MNRQLIESCKYQVVKIEDLNGVSKTDEGAMRRLGQYGIARVMCDSLLFIYNNQLSGFRTSKISAIDPTETGVMVTTLNTKYYLDKWEKNHEKKS